MLFHKDNYVNIFYVLLASIVDTQNKDILLVINNVFIHLTQVHYSLLLSQYHFIIPFSDEQEIDFVLYNETRYWDLSNS